MPRKFETKEQQEARNRYQREIHSKKIDFIGKLAELFLGDAAKKMEVKQIIEAVFQAMAARHPERLNTKNRILFRRTLEYDGMRASIWASSDSTKNRAKFEQKIAVQKGKNRMIGLGRPSRPTVLKQPVKTPVRPSPLTLPQKPIFEQPNPRRALFPVKTMVVKELELVDTREFAPMWHQPDEEMEEFLQKLPVEELAVDVNQTWERDNGSDEQRSWKDETADIDDELNHYFERHGRPFDMDTFLHPELYLD